MKSSWLLGSLVLVTQLGACATAKVDTTRPINRRGNIILGESYDQGGERLDTVDMWTQLGADEKTREEVTTGKRWELASGLLIVGGAALAGVSLGSWEAGAPPNWTTASIGAGLFAVGIPLGYVARKSFDRAIDTYNDNFVRPANGQAPAVSEGASEHAPAAFRWTTQVGIDFGFRELAWVQYPNGERRSLHINDGLSLRCGGVFFAHGAFETELKAGIKFSSLDAGDDRLWWLTLPVEALEGVNLGPVRLAAGIAFHPFPWLGGTGKASAVNVDFDPAVGPVAEVRLQTVLAPLRRSVPFTTSFGVRYEWLSLSAGGQPLGGSAVGLFSQTAY